MTMATMGVAALSDCAAASLASPFATLTSLHRSKTATRITLDRACRDWSSLAVLTPGMNPARHTRRNYSAEKKCCLHQMPITAAHRKASLRVRKQESVPLVTLTDNSGVSHHLSSFLQQPAGTQSMLNTRALMRYEYVGDDVYWCYLPKVTLLNFEVAPIIDLFVAASDVDCRVDMRQCSDQNERFSASLKNHLIWHDTPEGDQVLNLKTELSVSLEDHANDVGLVVSLVPGLPILGLQEVGG
uniref:Uncharacterized protein n=1 Tax=Physcomitrium patens TaxID=3218 RepID=A0A2K1KI26_PHYPA|nr:hypothetical protein PHYPA_007121 [Physcomitrium patens]